MGNGPQPGEIHKRITWLTVAGATAMLIFACVGQNKQPQEPAVVTVPAVSSYESEERRIELDYYDHQVLAIKSAKESEAGRIALLSELMKSGGQLTPDGIETVINAGNSRVDLAAPRSLHFRGQPTERPPTRAKRQPIERPPAQTKRQPRPVKAPDPAPQPTSGPDPASQPTPSPETGDVNLFDSLPNAKDNQAVTAEAEESIWEAPPVSDSQAESTVTEVVLPDAVKNKRYDLSILPGLHEAK
jgi:hypothetical protein